jgi:hypothetical protein
VKISPAGQQALQILSIRTDTLNKTDNGGTPEYVHQEPYAVVRDDFQKMAESADTTSDEKSLAKLGLLMNETWVPGAGISRKQVFQAHVGMLNSVQSEYAEPSKDNVGSVLARATLSAIDNALQTSPGMASWHKDGLSASLLGAGFEAVIGSKSSREQKSLARKSLKALKEYEYGELPTAEMEKIAGRAPKSA